MYWKYFFKKIDSVLFIENGGFKLNYQGSSFFEKEYKINPTSITKPNYSLYNPSGRLSSSNNNFNAMAIPTTGIAREEIVSKFKNGRLVYYDYREMEIRLILNYLSINFKEENIYNYFSSLLNIPERKKVKELIYSCLYGMSEKNLENFLDIRKINVKLLYEDKFLSEPIKLKNEIYDKYIYSNDDEGGYITSIYDRKFFVKKSHSGKIFNDWVKSSATDFVLMRLYDVIENVLKGCKTDIALFLHDGILFDYNPEDDIDILKQIKNKLENGNDGVLDGKWFPVKITYGKNFMECSK